jgi:hypothetical protein
VGDLIEAAKAMADMTKSIVNLTEHKHTNSPDIELDIHITGVRSCDEMSWQVLVPTNIDPETLAGVFEQVAQVLRGQD